MKKGYYIHFDQKDGKSGVSKKIDDQITVLKNHCQLIEINIKERKRVFYRKILSRLPFCSIAREYAEAISIIDNPDFIYVRRAFADRAYYSFFKYLKKKFPNLKLIIEIYTYPYDKDDFGFHKGLSFLYYPKDKFYRNQLKRIVDRYVTYSYDTEIFGVKTINILNGINFKRINLLQNNNIHECINIIALGIFQNHSGYDRILKGLANYYKQGNSRNIKIFFIGKDISKKQETIKLYQEIIEQNNLQQRIEFCGYLTDSEQNTIFENAVLALGSFGAHRDGIKVTSELKSRTYLARGIPIIAGCGIDVLEKLNVDFFLEFPADESIIDFKRIVQFYDDLLKKYTKDDLQQIIRKFGEEHVDINKTLLPVIEYINEDIK